VRASVSVRVSLLSCGDSNRNAAARTTNGFQAASRTFNSAQIAVAAVVGFQVERKRTMQAIHPLACADDREIQPARGGGGGGWGNARTARISSSLSRTAAAGKDPAPGLVVSDRTDSVAF